MVKIIMYNDQSVGLNENFIKKKEYSTCLTTRIVHGIRKTCVYTVFTRVVLPTFGA